MSSNRVIFKIENDHSIARRRVEIVLAVLLALAMALLLTGLISRSFFTGETTVAGISQAADASASAAVIDGETEDAVEEADTVTSEPLVELYCSSFIRSGVHTGEYEQPVDEYAAFLMPNVDTCLNVRAEAEADAEVVGYLYKGDAATVVETEDDWYHITSGNVDGWVNADYVVVGDEARELAHEICELRAEILDDEVWVRQEPSSDSHALVTVWTGHSYPVKGSDGEWIEIEYASDGSSGFIRSEFVEVGLDTGTGLTVEEVEAIEAAQRAAEEAERQARAAEAERQARAAAQAQAAAQAAAQQTEAAAPAEDTSSQEPAVAAVQQEATPATYDDAYLIACTAACETNSYEGMVAVANVIINRVNDPRYPNTISEVIYQPHQFSTGSRFQRNLANGPGSTALAAANEALSGTNLVPGLFHFGAARSHSGVVVIGGNAFY